MASCLVRAMVRSMEPHRVAGTATRMIPMPAEIIRSGSATVPASTVWARNGRSNSACGSCFKPLFFLQGHQTQMLVAFFLVWARRHDLATCLGWDYYFGREDNPMFRLGC